MTSKYPHGYERAEILSNSKEKDNKVPPDLEAYVAMESTSTSKMFDIYIEMSGREYWYGHGRKRFPFLAPIAIRVVSAPTSSAAAERVWSIYSFIWSKRRNRLSATTVEKLTFNFCNSSLLDDRNGHKDLKALKIP
ncbi:hypothetical protein PHMEG_00028630 [Phytophthora megakarya]|uniref:HAT C-terminal dimerisation domain-containing protein n=1 Tax=Phytophthora megakarya TaxID=4795 RepID=A0A225V5H7_9STRA|nr:hypothetical protein PHMEG_00028630 [Phytophthora megakarya]